MSCRAFIILTHLAALQKGVAQWCCRGGLQCVENYNVGDCYDDAEVCYSECNRCNWQEEVTWVCGFGCKRDNTTFNIITCIKGNADKSPCIKERFESSCQGELIDCIQPNRYAQTAQCLQAAQALEKTPCSSSAVGVTRSAVSQKAAWQSMPKDTDPCNPDPNGQKHDCVSNCTKVRSAGYSEFCEPFGGGTLWDCKVCQPFREDQSCNVMCQCRYDPPASGCPKITNDQDWGQCGTSPSCCWCQNKHSCEPIDDPASCPAGYLTSCGKPILTTDNTLV